MSFKVLSLLLIALVAVTVVSCTTEVAKSPTELAGEYVDAWNQADTTALEQLLADDATWEIGGHSLEGREDIIGLLPYHEGMNTSFELVNATAEGESVRCELIERNDFIGALGVPEVRHYALFVVKDGKIASIAPTRPMSGHDAVHLRLQPFRIWLVENHPEELSTLEGPGGSPLYAKETAQALVRLAKEWSSQLGSGESVPEMS